MIRARILSLIKNLNGMVRYLFMVYLVSNDVNQCKYDNNGKCNACKAADNIPSDIIPSLCLPPLNDLMTV